MPIRILIVDAYGLVREGLRMFLVRDLDLRNCRRGSRWQRGHRESGSAASRSDFDRPLASRPGWHQDDCSHSPELAINADSCPQ